MPNSRAVACCLLNISEARNAVVVERIARAAVAHQLNASPIQTSVLNVFRDQDYNRSVITLASTDTAALKRAVVDACTVGELFWEIVCTGLNLIYFEGGKVFS